MDYILPRDSEDAYGIIHRNPKIPKKCDHKTVVSSSYPCTNAIDYDNNSYFCSDRTDPFPWISFEFPHHDIVITNYSITYFTGSYGINSYIVEGKFREKWYLLDNVTNAVIKEPRNTSTRPISYPGIFSVFKLTMTKTCPGGGYEFRIKEFDVFGSVQVKKRSCVHKNNNNKSINNIYFVILLELS